MRSADQLKVVVPARIGSRRIKLKSLRLLDGRPLIEYCLEAMANSKHFRDVTINSDSELFAPIAARNGVQFYQRRAELATSASMIDDFLYDFMVAKNPAYLAMVCPTAPFVTASFLDGAWQRFATDPCDTLLSCDPVRTHCFFESQPINFSTAGQHPRSQDLEPVRALTFAVAIWDCARFCEQYEREGHGVYAGRLALYDSDGLCSVDIDTEDDFALAELIARRRREGTTSPPRYDRIADKLLASGIDTTT